MSLPETSSLLGAGRTLGWLEYPPDDVGQHIGSLIADALREKDEVITSLESRLTTSEREREVTERENELLRHRLNELEPNNGLLAEEAA